MKTKLLIILLFFCLNIWGQVPNTTTFTLQNVVDYINPTTNDLVDCFADSDAAKFDPNYGSKTMSPQTLLGFRYYGGCPEVGDFYQGGLVFYLFVSGDAGYVAGECHGLIVETDAQGTVTSRGSFYWHATNNGLVSYTSTVIGTGSENTGWIVYTYEAENNAAKVCYDLSLNGYTDWFLPSRDEAFKLAISSVLPAGVYYFWSSSEYSESKAWKNGQGTGASSTDNKDDVARVYAVRSF